MTYIRHMCGCGLVTVMLISSCADEKEAAFVGTVAACDAIEARTSGDERVCVERACDAILGQIDPAAAEELHGNDR